MVQRPLTSFVAGVGAGTSIIRPAVTGVATKLFNDGGVPFQEGVAESQNTAGIPRQKSEGISPAVIAALMNNQKDDNALLAAVTKALTENAQRSEEPKTPAQQVDSKMAEMLKKLDEKIGNLEKDLGGKEKVKEKGEFQGFFDTVESIKKEFDKGNYKLSDEQRQTLKDQADLFKSLEPDKGQQIDSIVNKIEFQSDIGDFREAVSGLKLQDETKFSDSKEFTGFISNLADRANSVTVVPPSSESITKLKEIITPLTEGANPGEPGYGLEHKVDKLVEGLDKLDIES